MNRKTEEKVQKDGYCCLVSFLKKNITKTRVLLAVESGVPVRTLSYWYSKYARGKCGTAACYTCKKESIRHG